MKNLHVFLLAVLVLGVLYTLITVREKQEVIIVDREVDVPYSGLGWYYPVWWGWGGGGGGGGWRRGEHGLRRHWGWHGGGRGGWHGGGGGHGGHH